MLYGSGGVVVNSCFVSYIARSDDGCFSFEATNAPISSAYCNALSSAWRNHKSPAPHTKRGLVYIYIYIYICVDTYPSIQGWQGCRGRLSVICSYLYLYLRLGRFLGPIGTSIAPLTPRTCHRQVIFDWNIDFLIKNYGKNFKNFDLNLNLNLNLNRT